MSGLDTRQRILDAAERLIVIGGYARLTTKDIAREARCAEGTIFNHFGRKEDLCLAVVLQNAPAFRQAISEIQPGKGSTTSNLQHIAVAAIHFFKRLIPLSVSLLADADLLLRHRQSMAENGRGPKDVFELVARYVSEEQQLGRVRKETSAMNAASLLLGACFHRVFIAQVTGKDLFPLSDTEIAAELVSALNSGLTPKRENPTNSRRPTKSRG